MTLKKNNIEEMEIERTNLTPAEFASYVRAKIRKARFETCCAEDIDLNYWKLGNDLNFYYYNETDKPCKSEVSVSKPYEMQTYVLNWDGTVYNMIMEFNFDNEKKGSGYFYYKCTWN